MTARLKLEQVDAIAEAARTREQRERITRRMDAVAEAAGAVEEFKAVPVDSGMLGREAEASLPEVPEIMQADGTARILQGVGARHWANKGGEGTEITILAQEAGHTPLALRIGRPTERGAWVDAFYIGPEGKQSSAPVEVGTAAATLQNDYPRAMDFTGRVLTAIEHSLERKSEAA